MKILIIGGGGREHALAWKMAQSPQLEKLFIAPGNAGTAEVGTNVPIGVQDFDGIKELVLKEGIELVVVGPEVANTTPGVGAVSWVIDPSSHVAATRARTSNPSVTDASV